MTGRGPVTIGFLPVGHDPSIAIVEDDGVIAVAEEERYSRVKRGEFVTDPRWLGQVLDEFEVDPARVTALAIPNINGLHERRPSTWLSEVPVLGQARLASSIVDRVSTAFPNLARVEHHRHHRCHAASAFYPSPFSEATVVTVDGMGETESATISHGRGQKLETAHSRGLPQSLGYVYQALAWWSGLTGGEREGKFMGLASWGKPTRVDLVAENFVRATADGGFEISPALAARPMNSGSWNAYTMEVLGAQRAGDPDVVDPLVADISASIQVILEEALLAYCSLARELAPSPYLCLAGGVFMNTVANGVIRRSGLYDEVWVQPLAGDNGLALGAALASHATFGSAPRRWVMNEAYLGSNIDPGDSTGSALTTADTTSAIVDRVLNGEIGALAFGRSEVGSRALGHRSVVADARDPESGQRINTVLKRREQWRPFAPIVLEEDALAWGASFAPSPFMTFVDEVPEVVQKQFPAVVHIDGTARLQTVPPEGDPVLRAILEQVKARTGTGILLNTSLNGPGSPIVRTRSDALALFLASGLDFMLLGDDLLEPGQQVEAAQGCACPDQRFDVLVHVDAVPGRACAPRHASRTERVLLRADSEDGPLRTDGPIPVTSDESVLVLLPSWTDLAAEFLPRLVMWLARWQESLSTPLHLTDAAGHRIMLEELLNIPRPGVGGFGSEIETFWLRRNGGAS